MTSTLCLPPDKSPKARTFPCALILQIKYSHVLGLYQFLTSEIKQIRDLQNILLQTKHILTLPCPRFKLACSVDSPVCLSTTVPTPLPIISVVLFLFEFLVRCSINSCWMNFQWYSPKNLIMHNPVLVFTFYLVLTVCQALAWCFTCLMVNLYNNPTSLALLWLFKDEKTKIQSG